MKKELDKTEDVCYTKCKIKHLLLDLDELLTENANNISYQLYNSFERIIADLEGLMEDL
jgi:hypothetical protein